MSTNRNQNTIEFVIYILDRLEQHGIQVWLSGGWAEELLGIIPTRLHHDVDLLYIAPSFERLEAVITQELWDELVQKHFPHKRAVLVTDIMIEFILVEQIADRHQTSYFNQYCYVWPNDSFNTQVTVHRKTINVASPKALQAYRENYDMFRKAAREYMALINAV